jgi:hypothetical protein
MQTVTTDVLIQLRYALIEEMNVYRAARENKKLHRLRRQPLTLSFSFVSGTILARVQYLEVHNFMDTRRFYMGPGVFFNVL